MAALSHKNQNLLFLIAVLFLSALSWQLAIKKTIKSWSLHQELDHQLTNQSDLSVSPVYNKERLHQIEVLLGRYRVDTAIEYNQFWMKASTIAAMQGAGIDYEPGRNVLIPDSTTTGLRQSIRLTAPFAKLVLILDSLEHTEGIGRISSAEIRKGQEAYGKKLKWSVMELRFSAIQK